MESHKLYMRVAQKIRSQIESGEYRPGTKLPPLAHLAETYQCSRATVREALGMLRGQGLVEFRHGDGTYVRTASVEMWMEPLEAAWLLGIGEVEDLLDTLIAVLAGVATVAARERGSRDYSALSYAVFEMECAAHHMEARLSAELRFFEVLAQVAENSILENAFRILQEPFRSALRVLGLPGDLGISICRELYHAVQMEKVREAREIVYRYGDQLRSAVARARQGEMDAAATEEKKPTKADR
ncbi:FadR/GntR family transcriptional regulator [Alicyclobacillus tolerans]|uniref:Transcriptional regulator, GntR family n=1 Tax=Alicyclobacillus tolerans TaxID=90970 RepID=A0A1M6P5B1_9BACL|nr:GntR family transcriptional regulator [Alicyclobacillus montanus]SHK03076.1 transcriptional regulator, GntR family [Alicyclobacillus montanus]